MASSISCGYALYLDGSTINGVLGRTFHVAATFLNTGSAQVWGGVLPSGGQLGITAGSGMSVNVATGYCVVPNSTGSTQGGYLFGLMSAGTLSVTAADPTNPRIDLVCATVVDNGNSSSFAEVQIVTGTPAPSPSAPATPANSLGLVQLTVPAGSTSVSSGNISSILFRTVAQGGILPVQAGYAPAGYTGMYIHDPVTGRLLHNPGSGPTRPLLLPWPPVFVQKTANFTLSTSIQTILSVNITTDGNTDIKVTTHWAGLYQPSTTGNRQIQLTTWLDGNQLDEVDLQTNSTDLAAVSHLGGTSVYSTSSASGDTPSAGTHTVYFKGVSPVSGGGAGDAPVIRATAQRETYLRVEPVNL